MEGRKDHYRVGTSLSIAEFFGVANAQLDGSKSDLAIVTIRSSENENQIASSTFAGKQGRF
jgi:hypothetical protein